jgi:heat shock protein HslJ
MNAGIRQVRLSVAAAFLLLVACASETREAGDAGTPSASTGGSMDQPDALLDREWRFVQAGGQDVIQPGEGQGGRVATLRLSTEDSRAAGSSGCNQMGGGYTLNGESLQFSQMISTKMACEPQLMDQETRIHAALEATRRWATSGDTLVLYAEGDSVSARLIPAG